MVWPPSVRGILVTEGVRGEGGVLKNSEGRRFMFDDIPENYRAQTADTPEEGWRYVTGDKDARRPPELLTRDHVARCIVREVREGRGSPHGGVFLDIAWIKEKIPKAADHIRKKLPMYHQFKKLAELDITATPMEVGPTTHYIMGGIRVDGDSQMSTLPGLFAAGEAAAGLHGANRLGGNSLSDLLVFGKRAGEFAAEFARSHPALPPDGGEVNEAARDALAPFDRPTEKAPTRSSTIFIIDADPCRHRAGRMDMRQGSGGAGASPRRAARRGRRTGNQSGLAQPRSTCSPSHLSEPRDRRAGPEGEPGGTFGRTSREADRFEVNFVWRPGSDGGMVLDQEPIPQFSVRSQFAGRGIQIELSAFKEPMNATFESSEPAAQPPAGLLQIPVSEGMVVLDAVHDSHATHATISCAVNCKPGNAGLLRRNQRNPRLMCMTRAGRARSIRGSRWSRSGPFRTTATVADVSWNYRASSNTGSSTPGLLCARRNLTQTEDVDWGPGIPQVIDCSSARESVTSSDHHLHEISSDPSPCTCGAGDASARYPGAGTAGKAQ